MGIYDRDFYLSRNSFEIVPAQNKENRSPVYHAFSSLGLESWCVEPLYCYVYRRLLEFRKDRRRCKEPKTVARWLLGALLINPNVIMLWNMRRELARNYRLDPSDELLLTRLMLYYKPNSYEAYAYRRWLMPQVLDDKQIDLARPYDPAPADSPICAEIDFVESCANRYANNYHAWSYRRYLVTLRESRGLTHPSLEREWRNTLSWCQQHVSDNSGHSYRQFLLMRCLLQSVSSDFVTNRPNVRHDYDTSEREEKLLKYMDVDGIDDFRQVFLLVLCEVVRREDHDTYGRKIKNYIRALSYWTEDCQINEQLISMFEYNEVLWYHRRFLAHTLARLIATYVRHGRYVEEELLDVQRREEPITTFIREKAAIDDAIIAAHVLLVEAFHLANGRIAEKAKRRDSHEKLFVERFLSFTASLGFNDVT